ncbi:MAG: Maf family protein [Pseudomonadota bacterium]
MKLVLASASPRRLELLRRIGFEPASVRPADIDETPLPRELPAAYCLRVAMEKAHAVIAEADEAVLAADTTVALGRRILGKAGDQDEARQFLLALSGRRHVVVSAVVVRRADLVRHRVVKTTVKMKRLSEDELQVYLIRGEWQGKAGAYGIQGQAEALIPWIRGSYSAVVGLPLAETKVLLESFGLPPMAPVK